MHLSARLEEVVSLGRERPEIAEASGATASAGRLLGEGGVLAHEVRRRGGGGSEHQLDKILMS